MHKTKSMIIVSLLALFACSHVSGQKKVITFDLAYEPGWALVNDIDQLPGKAIIIPMIDSAKRLLIFIGDSPVDLQRVDSVCFLELNGKNTKQGLKMEREKGEKKHRFTFVLSEKYQKWGVKVTRFPVWIQMGYKQEDGTVVLSRRYRLAKRI